MKKKTLCISLFFFSCYSIAALSANAVMAADTTSLKGFPAILFYYSKKQAALESEYRAIKQAGTANKVLGKNKFEYATKMFLLITERNNKVFEFLKHDNQSRDKLKAIFLLVKSNGLASSYIDMNVLDSIYATIPFSLRESESGIKLKEILQKAVAAQKATKYNTAILTENIEDAHGIKTTISNTNAKFYLLDFWSSWCSPCRYKNKLLSDKIKALYAKSIAVIAISLDENREQWLRANSEDNIHYPSFCDLMGLRSPFVKAFKITAIPQNVIIDTKGNIIKKNVWEEELQEFMNALE